MKSLKKKIIRVLWILFILGWVSVGGIFIAIYKGWIGYMPPVEELQNPIDKYASQLISSDGQILGSFAQKGQNRIYVDYAAISPNVIHALIATEDKRFREHSGIDFISLPRVIFKTVIFGRKSAGGGSTITQQLAKQLYSAPTHNRWIRFFQKPIEWAIAVKLEKYYTKDEIISMYLNQFDFLYNAVGIKSAALTYFDKEPKDLNIQEAATLIGMCKNPAIYNPVLRRHSKAPIIRRNVVLDQMRKVGYLTDRQCDSLKRLPIITHFVKLSHTSGSAPYLREYLRQIMMADKPERSDYHAWQYQQYKDDSLAWQTNPLYGWCNKNRKADGSPYNIYTDGLKIHLTINSVMQRYAEEAMRKQMSKVLQPEFDREKRFMTNPPFSNKTTREQVKSMLLRYMKQTDRWRVSKEDGMSEKNIIASFYRKQPMQLWTWHGVVDTIMTPIDSIKYLKGILRSGFMAMNVHNGNVLAYVGGIDFGQFKYDMVSGARRQIGSTVKPMLYSLSMMEGLSPCDTVLHQQQTLIDANGRPWSPRNDNHKRLGEYVSISWGLQQSDNWVTAHLMGLTSPQTFLRILRSYGLQGPIDATVSMCLGTEDASIKEMVSAYSTFVDKGVRMSPIFVSRIVDNMGNIVANFTPHTTDVLPADAAYKMNYMLRNVVDGGTGSRLRSVFKLQMPLGGKTGTTQSNSDGWFIGFTPDIVAGCWVGGDDPIIHFTSMAWGQGAAAALPIFGNFIKKVYSDPSLGYKDSTQFDIPSDFDPCHSTNEETIVNINDTYQNDSIPKMNHENFM